MAPTVSKIRRFTARLRGTAAEAIPVSFEVQCECGCQVTGTRGTSWKQVDCPECSATLYILPAIVYPSTASVHSEVIGGSISHRLRVMAGELLFHRSKAPAAKKVASRQKDSGTGKPVTAPRRSLPRVSLPKFNPLQLTRRLFTPIRLLALAIVLLVTGTGYWMYNRSSLEQARQTWRESTDAIPGLLEGDDFEQLQEQLLAATQAGERLGRQGQEWRRISNLLMETHAVNSVSFETLTELLSDLAMQPSGEDADPGSVESALMQGVFIVDGYMDPADGGRGTYTLDMPVMTGDTPVRVLLALPPNHEYMSQNESRRLICAFQINGVSAAGSPGIGSGWQVDVDPQSFVLMTSERHCRELGFSLESDPSLADVLLRQRTFVDESAEWEQRHELAGAAPSITFVGN